MNELNALSNKMTAAHLGIARAWVEETLSFDQRNENHYISLPSHGILALSDGLGGAVAGKAAARVACEAIVQFLKSEARDRDATLPFVLRNYLTLPGNVLFNSLIHANRKVLELNARKGANERGGASVIAGYIDRNTLSLAAVGSVSARLIRGGQSNELITPRTWGRYLGPSPAAHRNWAGRLPLAALGVVEDLEPEVVELRLRSGDRVELSTLGPSGSEKNQGNHDLSNDPGQPEQVRVVWEID